MVEVEGTLEPRRVAPEDSTYPEKLRGVSGRGPVLYLRGAWDHVGRTAAIVGSRNASPDGIEVAFRLARDLAHAGVAVVSGLAHGIDGAAHRGALAAGGRSGAVLGTAIDDCYPPEHRGLQEEVAHSLGLLSELPPGSRTEPFRFARRNRLIAALADAVILVQGSSTSGALRTAIAARRLKRPVGAIPWDSRDPLGAAPHALIRAGTATLVRDVDDVLALLGSAPRRAARRHRKSEPAKDPTLDPSLSAREVRLFQSLRERPEPIDVVAERAQCSIADAGAGLLTLELVGLARREPGGNVRRCRLG